MKTSLKVLNLKSLATEDGFENSPLFTNMLISDCEIFIAMVNGLVSTPKA
jgi:hypothetical protein